MTSCSGPSNRFESLPVESHRIILGFLPDFLSLCAIVTASRSAHAAYILSSQLIQYIVFKILLSDSPQLSIESRWLQVASYVRWNTPDWHDGMDDFLAYHGPRIEKKYTLQPFEIGIAGGLHFHIVIENLMRLFSKATMRPSRDRASRPSKGDTCSFFLRHTESISIQRAFYRFQQICERPLETRSTRSMEYGVERRTLWVTSSVDCQAGNWRNYIAYIDS